MAEMRPETPDEPFPPDVVTRELSRFSKRCWPHLLRGSHGSPMPDLRWTGTRYREKP